MIHFDPQAPPPPPRLFQLFEADDISREELHAAMAVHARNLIAEMEEQRRNPVAAWMEQSRNKRAAAKLRREHDEAALREVLQTLAEQLDFPPAQLLWNATHYTVPLHCFIRTRHEPVFRVLSFWAKLQSAEIRVEYGATEKKHANREHFFLKRAWNGVLEVERRTEIE